MVRFLSKLYKIIWKRGTIRSCVLTVGFKQRFPHSCSTFTLQARKKGYAGEYQCWQCSVALPALINLPFSHFHLIKKSLSLFSGPLVLGFFFISHCNLLSHVDWHTGFMSFIALLTCNPIWVVSQSLYTLMISASVIEPPGRSKKIPQDVCRGCSSKAKKPREWEVNLMGCSQLASPGWKATTWPFISYNIIGRQRNCHQFAQTFDICIDTEDQQLLIRGTFLLQ